MLAFISLPRLYRRIVIFLLLLLALHYGHLALLRSETHRLISPKIRNGVLFRIKSKFDYAAGYIPAAFRPSAYLEKVTLREPTTREEWESLSSLEEEGDWSMKRSRSLGWRNRLWELLQHLRLTSTLSSVDPRSDQYHNDWEDFPPDIKTFKEWEYARALVYQGTGTRIQRFLQKAHSGKGVVVSVVGGSISRGRGLPISWDLDTTDEQRVWVPRSNNSKRDFAKAWHSVPRPTSSQDLYHPFNIHNQIYQFINKTFPAAQKWPSKSSTHGHRNTNVFVNGAQGGVGSDYFSGCWKEHIPEDSDLVLVDLGINDIRDLSSMENYELLLRSLLEMPSQPAVITVQPFSLLFPTLSGASSLHIDVAAYYDTPVLSLRDIVLPRILNDKTRKTSIGVGIDVGLEIAKWFRNVPQEELIAGDAKLVYVDEADAWVDLVHMSQHGHSLLAEMVIHYLQSQIGAMSLFDADMSEQDSHSVSDTGRTLEDVFLEERTREGAHNPGDSSGLESLIRTDIPGMLLTAHSSKPRGTQKSNPTCYSTSSLFENHKLGLNSNRLHYEGEWYEYTWGEKNYLVAKKPGSRFSFPFEVTLPAIRTLVDNTISAGVQQVTEYGQGYVKIGHLRSNVLGLGSLQCWVEQVIVGGKGRGQKEKPAAKAGGSRGTWDSPTRVDGWWNIRERNQGVMTSIADELLPGSYTLQCTVLSETMDPGGGTEVRLIAIVYG